MIQLKAQKSTNNRNNGGNYGKKKSSTNRKPSQTHSTSDTCFQNAITSQIIRRTLVQNFEKQFKRFGRYAHVTKGKSGKGEAFFTAGLKIMSAGGGNLTDLTCHNAHKSSGAKDMKSVAEELLQCKENIEKSCNYAAITFSNLTKASVQRRCKFEDIMLTILFQVTECAQGDGLSMISTVQLLKGI